jgi:hypothetical protein
MGAQRFKRDNELTNSARSIAVTLESYKQDVILKLIENYEYATFAEWSDADEFVANNISDFTNSFGFPYELIAKKMANEHNTSQQSFMRLCMKFIKEMSEKKHWDGRNAASVKTAKKIMEAFGDEPIALPCI